MEEQSTQEEAETREILRGFYEGKQNIHSFLKDVIKSEDTTRTGNLDMTELGYPKLPVRTYKELQLFCNDIGSKKSGWGDYFNKMSEIQTSTSLSKEAILLKLSATLRRESLLADVSPERKEVKENKGWFKKDNSSGVVQ